MAASGGPWQSAPTTGFGVAPMGPGFAPPSVSAPASQDPWQEWLVYQDVQERKRQIPVDRPLRYNAFQKGAQRLRTVFVTTPKTVLRGLQGDPNYSFGDAMLTAKVPYFLGGALLALSPFMGGNWQEGIKQTAAMSLFLVGNFVARSGINVLERVRNGVDLTAMFRNRDGGVEYKLISHDFPRMDLIDNDPGEDPIFFAKSGPNPPENQEYGAMARRMGVPDRVNSQKDAVKENLRHIIASSRTLKLLDGTLLSAIGAGYLSRSNNWLELPATARSVGRILSDSKLGVWGRLRDSATAVGGFAKGILAERLDPTLPGVTRKLVLFGALGAATATTAYILLRAGIPQRRFSVSEQGPLDNYLYQNPSTPFAQLIPTQYRPAFHPSVSPFSPGPGRRTQQ